MITRTHVAGFVGLVACAGALYWAKSEAEAVRERVAALHEDVETIRKAVRTLEAEAAWLERPQRLEAAAGQLGLKHLEARQFAALTDLDRIIPVADPTTASLPAATATSHPAAPAMEPEAAQ